MATVSIDEAKNQLEALFERAVSGEEVTILHGAGGGIRLVPIDKAAQRGADRFRGVFSVPDSFFDPMTEDELKAWGW